MTLFAFAVCAHVLTAIMGLGPIVGMAIIAFTVRNETSVAPSTWTALSRLARATSVALALMLGSGVLIEYGSGGSFHDTWWFRLSFFQLLALGALNGVAQRTLRRRAAGAALRRVSRIAWVMCALVAEITILMEVKPW